MALNSAPLHERQCWVSYVRYNKISGEDEAQSQDVWEAPMGVYCASAGEYDTLAAEALRDEGLGFLDSLLPKPINVWFTANGYDPRLAELAPKVDQQSWAQWGEGKQVGFETPISAKSKEEDESALIITEHGFGQLPNQSKIWPPMDRTWIDPQLKELLFGQALPEEHQHILKTDVSSTETQRNGEQPEDNQVQPLIRTYFIVDAHLRRKITRIFDLDQEFKRRSPGAPDIPGPNGNQGNIEYQSLFKGQAQEDLKEVAPYLIDMTLPDQAYEDDQLVPYFHRDFLNNCMIIAHGKPLATWIIRKQVFLFALLLTFKKCGIIYANSQKFQALSLR